jgi:hypothetical protein
MRRVFSKPLYFFIALGVGAVVFSVTLLFSALPLLAQFLGSSGISLKQRFILIGQVVKGSLADVGSQELLFISSISFLVGINIALALFYVRLYKAAPSSLSVAGGAIGFVSAIFGFGCVACGGVFLTAIATTAIGSGLIAALPFGGVEIGYLGVGFLMLSAWILAKAINKPLVCPI